MTVLEPCDVPGYRIFSLHPYLTYDLRQYLQFCNKFVLFVFNNEMILEGTIHH